MKRMRKKLFAILITAICCTFIFPVSALATDTEVPKGYVDPVSAMGTDSLWELWERLEEIYLVPYEANVALFDSFLQRAENKRFHAVNGAPLILKRGEVIPEYKLDISYGPIQYTLVDSTVTAEVSGEYVMKNIQFGTTKAKVVLHNVGGSYSETDDFAGTLITRSYGLLESVNYGDHYRLPEASYAAGIIVNDEDPSTLLLRADGYYTARDGGLVHAVRVHFRVAGVKLAKAGATLQDENNEEAKKSRGTSSGIFDKDKNKSSDNPAGPVATITISTLAILLSILFGNTGGFIPTVPVGTGGAPAPAPAGSGLSRWLRFDGDGDIEATDPVNGQRRTFVKNGDGTYTDPVSGATYTPEELSEQMEHRADNAGTIRQDEAQFRQNVSEDSQRNQERSDESRQLEKDLQRERQERSRKEKVERVATDLGMSGASEKQVIDELKRRMERDEEYRQKMNDYAQQRDTAVDILEATVDIADYTMAAGEAVVPGGKTVSATYKGIKNTVSTMAEKGASWGSFTEGVIKGGTEAATTVMDAGIGKAATAFGGTVAGEVAEAVNDGGDLTDALVKGTVKGTFNAASGAVGDAYGDAVGGTYGEMLGKDSTIKKVAETAGKLGEVGFEKNVTGTIGDNLNGENK
ncbi:MAG TPA: hypothetical protein PK074_10505 [Spirochaetales bacterium]|nr:hypothetical protein [Spirochaetales bacterium]